MGGRTSGANGQLLKALMIKAHSLIVNLRIWVLVSMRSSGGRFLSVKVLMRLCAPGARELDASVNFYH